MDVTPQPRKISRDLMIELLASRLARLAALGRVVMSKRERIIALEPHGKGLIGTTIQYPYEVRNADEYFEDIPDVKIAPDMLQLAKHIVDQKAGEFEPDSFRDRYEEALIEVIKKKQAHQPIKKGNDKPAAPGNVVNLMDALRRSLGTESVKPAARKPKKAEGQREMLMAISGAGKGKTSKSAARRKAS